MNLRKLFDSTNAELQAIKGVIEDNIQFKNEQQQNKNPKVGGNKELAFFKVQIEILKLLIAIKEGKDLSPSDQARLKALEEENAKLKAEIARLKAMQTSKPSLRRFLGWLAYQPSEQKKNNSAVEPLHKIITHLEEDRLSNLPSKPFQDCLMKIAERINIGVIQEASPPTPVKNLEPEHRDLLLKTTKLLIALGAAKDVVEKHPKMLPQLTPLMNTIGADLISSNGGHPIPKTDEKASLAAASFNKLLEVSQQRAKSSIRSKL